MSKRRTTRTAEAAQLLSRAQGGGSPYAIVPVGAIYDKGLSDADFRKLCALYAYMDENETARPHQDKIAPRFGISQQAISKALKHAEERGHIKSMRLVTRQGFRRGNAYQRVFKVPDLAAIVAVEEAEQLIQPPAVVTDTTTSPKPSARAGMKSRLYPLQPLEYRRAEQFSAPAVVSSEHTIVNTPGTPVPSAPLSGVEDPLEAGRRAAIARGEETYARAVARRRPRPPGA